LRRCLQHPWFLRTGIVLVLGSGLLTLAPGLALAYDGHTAKGQPCWATSGTINGSFHAAELDCIKDGSGAPKPAQAAPTAAPARPAQSQPPQPRPAQSQPVQPVQSQPVAPIQSQPVQPVQSQPVQPFQADPVAPVQSQSIDPVQAQPVDPVQSQEITPVQGQTLPAPSSCTPVDQSFFIHTYKTNVGGAAYTQDDLVNDQRLLFTSPGAISGGLVISADGTYEWTTAHSGHMTGNWVVDTTNACGAITLLQADSGADWTVQPSSTVGTIMLSAPIGIYFIGYALDS
jgi:hypothetical protein